MSKKFIGIDIDENRVLRAALATDEKGEIKLVAVAQRTLEEDQRPTGLLGELFGEISGFGNRTAAALPAGRAFVRRLTLPFADPKKIAAVLPFELSAQLPVPSEECITDFLKPAPSAGGGHTVMAAAVPAPRVKEALGDLEDEALPLNLLDLAPFAYAGGLRRHLPDGVLACLGGREVSLVLIVDGRPVDHRHLPPSGPDVLAQRLLRESNALQRGAGQSGLPLSIIGAGTGELRKCLEQVGEEVRIPAIKIDGETVQPEFLPAAGLAFRAAAPDREAGFNLRRGPFTLRNEWASIKKRLIAASLLLFLALSAGMGGAYIKYAEKARRAEKLEQRMAAIYRETFPRSQVIIDVPRQMRSGINELKKRGELMGTGSGKSALTTLREVSARIPEEITVDVRELSYSPENLRLEGVAGSFEEVNRMAKSLEQSPVFTEVQIADAKMSLDGSRVDFRFNILLGHNGEGS